MASKIPAPVLMPETPGLVRRMGESLQKWSGDDTSALKQKMRAQYDMLRVLSAALVRPFDTDSVDRYKAAYQRKVNFRRSLNWETVVMNAIGVFCFLGVLAAVFGWMISWKLSVAGLIVFAMCFLVIMHVSDETSFGRYERGFWETIELRQYSRAMPVDVVVLAQRIRDADARIALYVCHFSEGDERFLKVVLDHESLYVARWQGDEF